jgi:hypothetical protein
MPATTYTFYLILVDAYSRYVCIYGLADKSTTAVITTLQQRLTPLRSVSAPSGSLEGVTLG